MFLCRGVGEVESLDRHMPTQAYNKMTHRHTDKMFFFNLRSWAFEKVKAILFGKAQTFRRGRDSTNGTSSMSLSMSTPLKMVSQNSGMPLGSSSGVASSFFSSTAAFFLSSSYRSEWISAEYELKDRGDLVAQPTDHIGSL